MNIYDQVKSNFSKACEYSKNSTIQNQVRQLLLAQTIKHSKLVNYNHTDTILNLGVRDFSEPLELSKIFCANKIDVCDIVLPKSSTNIDNINTFKLNFDKDLELISDNYDLVFSNMSFQWSQNLKLLIKNISSKLNNRAILAFSTVLDNNFHQIKDILRINKMHNINDILDFIKNAKLKCLYQQDLYLDINFNNFGELAKHLKSTGVNTYIGDKNKQNYKSIKKLCLSPNQFNLSYHVGIFICFKE
ncbi:MAG: biotin synthase [Francisella endosymbiont of Hyalomma scupense]